MEMQVPGLSVVDSVRVWSALHQQCQRPHHLPSHPSFFGTEKVTDRGRAWLSAEMGSQPVSRLTDMS